MESLWYEILGRNHSLDNNTAYKRIIYKIHSVSYDLIISKVQMQWRKINEAVSKGRCRS